jgi:hypothetical protein
LKDILKEKRCSSPFQWWKINPTRFPALARLDKIYLGAPPTTYRVSGFLAMLVLFTHPG